MNNLATTYALEPIGSPNCGSIAPTYESSTLPAGKAEWVSSMRVYLARAGLLPVEGAEKPTTGGLIPSELSKKPAHQLSFWSASKPSSGNMNGSRKTSIEPVTVSASRLSPMLPAWVRLILGDDIGLLATPTTKANQCATSMQKWPSCRRLTLALGGKIHPHHWEWMMGWPIGFTAFGRRATDKSPSNQPPPSSCSEGR
jgi:hypothetical protein